MKPIQHQCHLSSIVGAAPTFRSYWIDNNNKYKYCVCVCWVCACACACVYAHQCNFYLHRNSKCGRVGIQKCWICTKCDRSDLQNSSSNSLCFHQFILTYFIRHQFNFHQVIKCFIGFVLNWIEFISQKSTYINIIGAYSGLKSIISRYCSFRPKSEQTNKNNRVIFGELPTRKFIIERKMYKIIWISCKLRMCKVNRSE